MNKPFHLDIQVNSNVEWRKNYKIKSHKNAGLFDPKAF